MTFKPKFLRITSETIDAFRNPWSIHTNTEIIPGLLELLQYYPQDRQNIPIII